MKMPLPGRPPYLFCCLGSSLATSYTQLFLSTAFFIVHLVICGSLWLGYALGLFGFVISAHF